MPNVENPGPPVVRGGEDAAGAFGIGRGEHGAGDLFWRTERDGTNGGTRAAEEGSERAGRIAGEERLDLERMPS